jgi:CheY-like chemotaxis protein
MEKKKRLLLLIEDNPLLMELYVTAFEHAGYDEVSAHSGEEGLAEIESKKPDGVILDLLMPGKVDGLGVLESIHGNAGNSGIKILVFSAAKSELLERAKTLGALECFAKPELSVSELVRRVSEHMGVEAAPNS